MHALEIQDLVKVYQSGTQALKKVSLTVDRGDFFALLGPNGAGKSTLIGIVTSLVQKTSGVVRVFGVDTDKDFSSAKTMMGVVPQEFNFNAFRKVEDVLFCQAGYYGISYHDAKKRVDKYLHIAGLTEKRRNMVLTLSGGMKRRLMVARAMLHEPRMLILDEPTAGVDIEIRRAMWQLMQEVNAGGTTIILTTHYLEEAENLCRHVAIIDHGQVIQNMKLAEFLRQLDRETFVLYVKSPLMDVPKHVVYELRRVDEITLEVDVPKEGDLTELMIWLQKAGIEVKSMRNKTNRLEELFLRLTQKRDI